MRLLMRAVLAMLRNATTEFGMLRRPQRPEATGLTARYITSAIARRTVVLQRAVRQSRQAAVAE